MSNLKLISLTAALATIALASACGSQASTAATASPLRVATLANSPTSLIQKVAIDQGFFAKAGVEVQIVPVANGPAAAALVTSKAADVGDIAGPTVVAAAVGKTPVKFLSDGEATRVDLIGLKSKQGPNAGKPYPQNILDVKGGRVGVPARGSQLEAVLTGMMKDAGLNPDKDVTWVATGTAPTTLAALKNHTIDFTVWPSAIVRTAFASATETYTLASTDDGNVGEAAGKTFLGLDMVLASVAEEREPDLVKYCTAMADVSEWMKKPENLDKVAATATTWLNLTDPEQAKMAASIVAAGAIPRISEQQWNDNQAQFPALGSAKWNDAAFKPCFPS